MFIIFSYNKNLKRSKFAEEPFPGTIALLVTVIKITIYLRFFPQSNLLQNGELLSNLNQIKYSYYSISDSKILFFTSSN